MSVKTKPHSSEPVVIEENAYGQVIYRFSDAWYNYFGDMDQEINVNITQTVNNNSIAYSSSVVSQVQDDAATLRSEVEALRAEIASLRATVGSVTNIQEIHQHFDQPETDWSGAIAAKADRGHDHWGEYATPEQGALADSAIQPGDNVSELVNDAGYMVPGDNVSELVNDVGYLVPGDNVSELVNDADYTSVGDNVSVFTNDADYTSVGDNVSVFTNDAGYLVPGDNVSELVNDADYTSVGDNVSVFTNDADYTSVGDNVSVFTNDADYTSVGDNVSVFANDADYTSIGDNVSVFANDADYTSVGDNVSVFANDADYTSVGDNVSVFTNDAGYITETDGDMVYVRQDTMAVANGVATLDSSGKIPASQMPPISITETFVVASQAAMLALTAQTGDVAVRTDENKSYILAGPDPTSLSDWQELLSPTSAVTSVNGAVGAVVLATADVAESGNLYFTESRVLGTDLAGFSAGSNTAIAATDTILQAFAKTQGQINALDGTAASALQPGDNVSELVNDADYTSIGDNVSVFTNDADYTSIGDNVSVFTNDADYTSIGDNVSVFTNDAGYITASSVITDHGALTGLSDDDHTQYHTDARGDARYPLKSNNLSDLASAATARTNLGLGTAATANVTTSSTDTTAGRMLKVGDFGIGAFNPTPAEADLNNNKTPGIFRVGGTEANIPIASAAGVLIVVNYSGTILTQTFIGNPGDSPSSPRSIRYRQFRTTWSPWVEEWNSANLSATTVGYLSGLTSNVQTQLDAKQPTVTGAATTITSSNLTADRAVISNASGKIAVSSVTSTEIGYLSGLTSNVQTQLDGKMPAGLRFTAGRSTSTNITLQLSDMGTLITLSGSGAEVTVPANSSVAFPIGATIHFVATGVPASWTITAPVGVSLGEAGSITSVTVPKSLPQVQVSVLVKRGADQWVLETGAV